MKKDKRTFGKILMIVLIIFFYAPILYMIVFSFNEGKSLTSFTGFSLRWYKHMLESQLELLNNDKLEISGTTLEEFVKSNMSKLDAATDKVSTLLENQGYLPAVAIDETGIYVASFDTTYNTIVNKYDFTLKGIGTTNKNYGSLEYMPCENGGKIFASSFPMEYYKNDIVF